MRSGWARLRSRGVASIWAPASQDSSHVGNAGVGVVSLRSAPFIFAYLCHCPVQEVLCLWEGGQVYVAARGWSVYASDCFVWLPGC